MLGQNFPVWTLAGCMTSPRDPAAGVSWALNTAAVGWTRLQVTVKECDAAGWHRGAFRQRWWKWESFLLYQRARSCVVSHLGPVHLIPSPCEERCGLGQSQDIGSFQSQRSLGHR